MKHSLIGTGSGSSCRRSERRKKAGLQLRMTTKTLGERSAKFSLLRDRGVLRVNADGYPSLQLDSAHQREYCVQRGELRGRASRGSRSDAKAEISKPKT